MNSLSQQVFVIQGNHLWLDCPKCGRKTLFRSQDIKDKTPYRRNIVCDYCHTYAWTIQVISSNPDETDKDE